MHDFFSGLSQSQRNIEQWLYLEEWLFPSFLADHYSWLATRLMNPRVSLVPSNKFLFFLFLFFIFWGQDLLWLWTEEKGSVLLGCCFPHWRPRRCSAPFSSSSRGYVSPPFSWWTWGPACPWRPWAAPWLVARRGEATHLPDHVPHEFGVFGETPAVAAVPRLAHVLGHLVTRVEAHGHGVAQSHGCCSTMAAAAEGGTF